MSGIEVAALVAAIISAFSGAHGLIAKFKKKRKERRLNKQNENAELALTSAGSRVQHEYDVDFRRLGSKFAKGDDICQRVLMEQVIKLQQTVIALLTKAQDLDLQTIVLPNVAQILSGTVSARDRSVTALKEQFQRMAVAAPFRQVSLDPLPTPRLRSSFVNRGTTDPVATGELPSSTRALGSAGMGESEEAKIDLAEYEVRALFSFEGKSRSQLSFEKGDVIKVMSRDILSQSGRKGVVALGMTRDGIIGTFLLDCVEGPGKTSPQSQSSVQEMETTTTPQNSTTVSNTTEEVKVELAKDEVVAQISFEGNYSASLSFKKGDIIKVVTRDVLSRGGKKGFVALGRTPDGTVGTFFLACVEGPGKTSPQSQSSVQKTENTTTPYSSIPVSNMTEETKVELAQDEVRAIFYYEGTHPHSLSLKKGDTIKVLKRDIRSRDGKKDIWVLGKTSDGRIGLVPLLRVEGPGKTLPEASGTQPQSEALKEAPELVPDTFLKWLRICVIPTLVGSG